MSNKETQMEGYKPFVFSRNLPSVFISKSEVRFNSTAVKMLGRPANVQFLINKNESKFAIKCTVAEDPLAIPFYDETKKYSGVRLRSIKLAKKCFDIAGWEWSESKCEAYKLFAFFDHSENALIVDSATAIKCV